MEKKKFAPEVGRRGGRKKEGAEIIRQHRLPRTSLKGNQEEGKKKPVL